MQARFFCKLETENPGSMLLNVVQNHVISLILRLVQHLKKKVNMTILGARSVQLFEALIPVWISCFFYDVSLRLMYEVHLLFSGILFLFCGIPAGSGKWESLGR